MSGDESAANEQGKPIDDPLTLHVKADLVFTSANFMPPQLIDQEFNHLQMLEPPVGSIEHNLGLV